MTARRRKINEPRALIAPPAVLFGVVLRVGDRERLFSRYITRPAAELVVARMRRHGFDAQIAEPKAEATG